MFGGGIVVTVLILIACALGMASIVYGHVEAARRNFLNGKKETLDEITVSETSFRNGVANTQLIWQDLAHAPDSIVDAFFDNEQRIVIKPYPSLVVGVPGQTGNRAEVARYLALSVLLARICAASSINRGRLLEGYHYSTRTGVFGLVPTSNEGWPALATPERRARALDALRIDFGDERPPAAGERPRVRWLPPYDGPVAGQTRIRLAAQAYADGEPFAVLVTEYAPEYLLSWQSDEHASDGIFFIATPDNRLVAMDRDAGADRAQRERLLALDVPHDASKSDGPVFRDGFVVFRGRLDSTGWILAYATSWTAIAAGVAWQAGTLVAATLLALAVMWVLLVRFHRRTLVPVYSRSQRVFDSEELCRNVIEMAPIGLGLIARSDRRLMFASGALGEMVTHFGGDRGALSAQVAERFEASSADASDGSMQFELPLTGPDNARLHLEVIARGARYQGEEVLLAAVVDVTAQQQLVRKLEEAVRAADSANAAKSSFLAAMSHEIRTPLNVILGNLELLDRSALDASQRSRVETLSTSSSGLLTLVNDILDFSKIEAGAMTVESIEFDVAAVIARELGAFAPIAKAKGLPLFCEIDMSSTQRMRGDPTRLAQVLGNLLNNAIKFTSDGCVTVRASVIRTRRGGSDLVMKVEDTGIGIADASRHKLFKAFSQVDASITREFGGTGLGLALCDRLVSAMGGWISVTSTQEAGSCFTVRLPLGMHAAPIDQGSAFGGCPLLLIAAQDEWRNLALPHLSAWGFDVDVRDRPTRTPAECYARASVVVLIGDSTAWPREELDHLANSASERAPIVLATPDGPLQPYDAGRTIRVSGYWLGGLRGALTQAMAEAASSAGRRRASGPPAIRGQGPLRVLLADDDTVNGSIFREQLDALGCTVRVVGCAKSALDALAADTWDVLLLAADLPDMRACALAETVRDLGFSCDVVAVTSHLAPDESRRYAAAGVEKVLAKPVTLAHLRAVLARVSRRRARDGRG
nr:ATP-binding protein [Burkholderia catarinensis]